MLTYSIKFKFVWKSTKTYIGQTLYKFYLKICHLRWICPGRVSMEHPTVLKMMTFGNNVQVFISLQTHCGLITCPSCVRDDWCAGTGQIRREYTSTPTPTFSSFFHCFLLKIYSRTLLVGSFSRKPLSVGAISLRAWMAEVRILRAAAAACMASWERGRTRSLIVQG